MPTWLLLSCLFLGVVTYPRYYPFVPNSTKVPLTCPGAKENETFIRIGHWPNLQDRNYFGKNFSTNWLDICDLDPDGDNRTNGEELGDALCRWDKDNKTTDNFLKAATSHPGIPEDFVTNRYIVREKFRERACPEAIFFF